MLAQRPWTDEERRIVWRGLTGRFAIAIEPFLGVLFFSLLTWGVVWRANHVPGAHSLMVLVPIFALGAVAFGCYFFAVLFAPISAYAQTRKPIYIIDGYVRYREPDDASDLHATGYMAALFEDASVAGEWECYGSKPLPNRTIPAHIEFSNYGGIHKIDGRSTGVLPDKDLPILAIGIAPRH